LFVIIAYGEGISLWAGGIADAKSVNTPDRSERIIDSRGDGTEGNFDQLIDWKLYILLLSTFLAQNKGIVELSGEFRFTFSGQTITRSPLTTNFPGRYLRRNRACAFGDLHQFFVINCLEITAASGSSG